MRGKDKCRILKQIRQQIADANDIEYITRECTYQGDCRGTCPKCESELRYLEEQLELRRSRGKKAVIAAVAAGIMLTTTTACDFTPDSNTTVDPAPEIKPEEPVLMGDVPAPTEEDVEATVGEPAFADYVEEGEVVLDYEESGVLDPIDEPEIAGGIPEPEEDIATNDLGNDNIEITAEENVPAGNFCEHFSYLNETEETE